MKNMFTYKDKLRLSLSAASGVVGALLMYSIVDSHRNNPPPDADIGGSIIFGTGMIMAVLGGACLFGSVLYVLLRRKLANIWLARGLAILIVGAVVSAGWYLVAGADLQQKSAYNHELQSRYGSFVGYQEPVDYGLVFGRKTDAVIADKASVTLSLHACSPGTAEVQDPAGTTYFAFSGIQRDEHTTGFSDCVFYIGRESAGQTGDRKLYAKCTWRINSTIAANTLRYPISASGIRFGDLPGSCRDSRTGTAPADLN